MKTKTKAKILSKSIILPLFLLSSFFLSTGCATVFNGLTERTTVTSFPERGRVIVDNMKFVGETPLIFQRRRSGKELKIQVLLEGYESKSFLIETHSSAWILGSILNPLAPLLIMIDSLTGAADNLNHSEIHAELKKKVPKTKHLREYARSRGQFKTSDLGEL